MGYKSVITTWKKIQDWVLELLEGLGLGTAYKYDKASDTATVKAGTIKNESGSFAWINSLGQWIINLGTNAAETWGILGNYRFGQDSNGHGTWNGIFQKDGNGNNLEVLHSDDGITQLMHKGEENFAASDSNANIKKISNTGTGESAFAVFSNYEVHIGSGPSPDNQKSGLEIRQYYRNAGGDGMGLKFRGRYIMDVNLYGSVFLAAIYNNMEYPCIRSGRDTLDKGFYTELLMANRAYQQIGVWETGGMDPTPPTPYTPSAGEYDYRFEYDALGRLIYECKGGYQKFYHPDNGVAYLDVYASTASTNYRVIFNENLKIAGNLDVIGYLYASYLMAPNNSPLSFSATEFNFAGKANFQSGIEVTENVKANNIPELVLPDPGRIVSSVSIAHHSRSSTELLPGDGQMGGNCYSYPDSQNPGHYYGYWSVGTGDPSGRGFWQNIPIPGNIEDYLDYEVIVNVRGTGDNHPLGIALCSNQGEATFGYARYVQTPSPDDFVDVNFGFVRDFQNRQNSMSIVINAESAQNRYDIMSIRLEKRNHPEGNYTLTAQVTMVNDEPQITYAWVKQ